MVMLSFRFSKKKTLFFVGVFVFAVTAVLFGGKLIGSVRQTASQAKALFGLLGGRSPKSQLQLWRLKYQKSLMIYTKSIIICKKPSRWTCHPTKENAAKSINIPF